MILVGGQKVIRVSAVRLSSQFMVNGRVQQFHITNMRKLRWMKGFVDNPRIEAHSKPLTIKANQRHAEIYRMLVAEMVHLITMNYTK